MRSVSTAWLNLANPCEQFSFACGVALSRRRTTVFVLLVLSQFFAFSARPETSAVLTIWRLLDYMAIDYREAVRDGVVVSGAEYAEMVEFVGSVTDRLEALPPSVSKDDLKKRGDELRAAIGKKAKAELVADLARSLAADLIKAYPVPLAPAAVPDYARGRTLYAEHCASCHGASGDGKGRAAAELKPPPIAFTNKDRASERSVFALYQVIEQGLDGTSMASFAHLPSQDRWDLALYVGSLAYPEADASRGQGLWKSDVELRQLTTLATLVGERPATLAARLGEPKAEAIIAYLRRNPAAVIPSSNASLGLTRTRLAEAIAAYEKGDRRAATDLALSAYLDGFEPVEPLLSTRNKELMLKIEGAMGDVRTAITRGASVESMRDQAKALDALFSEAEDTLDPRQATSASSFFGAFTVLLREALEALLIVVVMLTMLRKADRQEAIRYVHGGWVSALVVGIFTWAAATFLMSISGADRELTEGFGSVFAAVILLWVGIWMHSKSQAGEWQRYIHEKLGRALSRGSTWGLFGLTFVVVYREVFETILFYAAIWDEENAGAVLAGAATAVVVLAAIAWALMRYSRALPIAKFFSYSSMLLAVLCVVLIGKGVAALQEAGWLPVHRLAGFIRLDFLGLYPTVQGLTAQVIMALLLISGFWLNHHRASAQRAAGR